MESHGENSAQTVKVCTMCWTEYPAETVVCTADGSDLVSKAITDLVGKEFDGRYRIISLLGVGGIGAVYKGEHMQLKQLVALKVLHQDQLDNQEKIERFEREAKALSALAHINVVSAHDYGWTSEMCPYLVMQFVEGTSLEKVLVEVGGLPPDRAIRVFMQICEGLGYAHRKGIVHRDLKPANTLLVSGEGGNDLVKLVDFGLAKLLPDSGLVRQKLTQTGHVFGSPSYMSPEQWRGQRIDNRSDIYSMGCMFYELLSGKKPYEIEELLRVMLDREDIKPQMLGFAKPGLRVSADLEEIILKTLESDVDKRYQTVDQVKEALEKTPEWIARREEITSSRSRLILDLRQKRMLQVSTRALVILAILLVMAAALLAWVKLTDVGATQAAKLSLLLERMFHSANDPTVIASQRRLAFLYLRQGYLGEAAAQLEAVAAGLNDAAGTVTVEQADTYDRLAEIYSQIKGQEGKAKEYACRAAKTYDALSITHERARELDQAIELARKSLPDKERCFGPENFRLALSLRNIAEIEVINGSFFHKKEYIPLAGRDFKRALELLEKSTRPDRMQKSANLRGLGIVYALQNKTDLAIECEEKSLSIAESFMDRDVRQAKETLAQMEVMAATYCQGEQYTPSRRLYEQIIRVARQGGYATKDQLIHALNGYSDVLVKTGRANDAEKIKAEAHRLSASPSE